MMRRVKEGFAVFELIPVKVICKFQIRFLNSMNIAYDLKITRKTLNSLDELSDFIISLFSQGSSLRPTTKGMGRRRPRLKKLVRF